MLKLEVRHNIECETLAYLNDLIDDFLKDPINPLPPQRFEINDISSNSISFSWSPPFHCGGGNILEYDLTYEEEVPAYNQAAGMSKQGVN